MKKVLTAFSFLLFSTSLPSLSQKVYDLNECIKTGLERNFSLLITRNSEEIAKNNYTAGNAGFLPSLSLSGRHSGSLNDERRNLGDTSMSVTNGIFNTSSNAQVSLGLTIFEGFNVSTTYKKLGELKKSGEFNTRLSAEYLVTDIISGYFYYINQVRLQTNIQYAVTLSRERLRIDEDRYLLGSGSKLQVLQSRVYLNADSSRLSKQKETVRAARIRLNELMAIEDLGALFTTKDTSIEVNHNLLYEKLLDEMLEKNVSLLIASTSKTISEYDYRLVKSRSYPYITASSGYNFNFNTFSSGSSKNTQSNGLNYGVTVGVTLFDGMNQRRSLKNSIIEMENKELRYQETEQGLKADLITIYSAYSNYLRLIELEKQNLQTAEENLSIAMERYRLGSLSGIDLREVQKSFLDSRESLLNVQYQAKLAEISLKLISGTIMDYYQ